MTDAALTTALANWSHGYCPACGSWPALAEIHESHRVLRCSFCAHAWELKTYACVYCGSASERFVTFDNIAQANYEHEFPEPQQRRRASGR